MLEKLMTEIQNGGTLTPDILAERLGTSPRMVEAMLDHLARLGKLHNVAPVCSQGTCSACALNHQPHIRTVDLECAMTKKR